jgi:hypothetical protein
VNTKLSVTVAANEEIDLNVRRVKNDFVLLIESDKDLTIAITNGFGGSDPANEDSAGALKYVEGGSAVPIFSEVPVEYTITGGTKEEILFVRAELGDWVRLDITNDGVGDATVNLYGTVR